MSSKSNFLEGGTKYKKISFQSVQGVLRVTYWRVVQDIKKNKFPSTSKDKKYVWVTIQLLTRQLPH